MLDKSAIQELSKSEHINAANTNLRNATLASLPLGALALPKEFDIHNLEKYEANRYRFRGTFQTSSPDNFALYVKNKAAENCSCFISTEEMNAATIFNIGNTEAPGHCDDRALLSLEMTAPYEALLAIITKRLPQKDIAEFIEDWRAHITASSEEDQDCNKTSINIVKALHAIRKITIEAKSSTESETRNFGASNTSMESIDVKSADMPPAYLHFTCEPYLGLPARTFDLRLSVITDRSPALVLRIVRHESHKEEMAEEFEAIINTKLGEVEPKVNVLIGKFSS